MAVVRAGVGPGYAEDAAQEAVLAMLRAPGREVRRVESPLAWLSVLALNWARNAARADGRRLGREVARSLGPAGLVVGSGSGSGSGSGEAVGVDGPGRGELRAALEALEPTDGAIVVLKCAGGLSYAAIGSALGMARSTVADRYAGALLRLRAALGGDDGPIGERGGVRHLGPWRTAGVVVEG